MDIQLTVKAGGQILVPWGRDILLVCFYRWCFTNITKDMTVMGQEPTLPHNQLSIEIGEKSASGLILEARTHYQYLQAYEKHTPTVDYYCGIHLALQPMHLMCYFLQKCLVLMVEAARSPMFSSSSSAANIHRLTQVCA